MSDLRIKEQNGQDYLCCPTCSRMVPRWEQQPDPAKGISGVLAEVPSKCKRCGGPMDADKALQYAETLAEREHKPELTSIGERMRAMARPDADKMVRSAPNK